MDLDPNSTRPGDVLLWTEKIARSASSMDPVPFLGGGGSRGVDFQSVDKSASKVLRRATLRPRYGRQVGVSVSLPACVCLPACLCACLPVRVRVCVRLCPEILRCAKLGQCLH
jgi:hypothetical protein